MPTTPTQQQATPARIAWALAAASALLVATPISRLHTGLAAWYLGLLVAVPPLVVLWERRRALPGTPLPWSQRAALLLAALVLVGGAVQIRALAALDPSTVVAVSGATAAVSLRRVAEGVLLHLVFPAAWIVVGNLVERRRELVSRGLPALSLLLIPSAVVALVQILGRIEQWNVPHFVRHGRASGWSYDANSLAAALFLVLPLALLGAVQARTSRGRLAYAAAMPLLLAALVASGNRTAIAAALVAGVTAPWIAHWIAPPAVRWRRLALLLAPLPLALVTGLALASLPARASEPLGGLSRLVAALDSVREQGVDDLLVASGRSDLWRQAARMWRESPLAGVGPGGYARELPNYRHRFEAAGAGRPIDLATSHYLQVAAELGAVGLLLHLALLVGPLVAALVCLRRALDPASRRPLAVVASTLLLALPLLQFNHYLLFPDVAWLLAALLAWLAAASGAPTAQRPLTRRQWVAAALVLALFTAASAANAFGARGYTARREAAWWPLRHAVGCYPSESWQGVATRWCAPQARLAVPVAWPGDGAVVVSLLALHPDLAARPLAVELRTAAGRSWRLALDRPEWRSVRIPLDAAALRPCLDAAGRRADCLALEIVAARGWRPSDGGDSDDDRLLGVAVRTRALPDLARDPHHLFSDDFESGDLARWRLGTADD